MSRQLSANGVSKPKARMAPMKNIFMTWTHCLGQQVVQLLGRRFRLLRRVLSWVRGRSLSMRVALTALYSAAVQ